MLPRGPTRRGGSGWLRAVAREVGHEHHRPRSRPGSRRDVPPRGVSREADSTGECWPGTSSGPISSRSTRRWRGPGPRSRTAPPPPARAARRGRPAASVASGSRARPSAGSESAGECWPRDLGQGSRPNRSWISGWDRTRPVPKRTRVACSVTPRRCCPRGPTRRGGSGWRRAWPRGGTRTSSRDRARRGLQKSD